MGTQSLKGALASDEGSDGKAYKGNHGKAAVFHFLNSHLGGVHACGIKGEGIEETARLGLLPSLVALELKEANDQELKGEESVVREPVLLSASLEPLGLAKGLSGEDTGNGSHCPATICLLGFSIPSQTLGVSAQAQGIKSVVCNR